MPPPPAIAQTTYTWDPLGQGSSGSDSTSATGLNWDTSSDYWYSNSPPTDGTTFASAPTDIVNIGAGTNSSVLDTITINVANITVGTINFDAGSAGYTIAANGSNTLTIGGTGSNTNNSISIAGGSGPVTINAPTIISKRSQYLDEQPSSLLLVSSLVANGGNTLTVNGSGTTLLTGGSSAATGGLTMSGTSALLSVASSSNTYGGTTSVTAGTLRSRFRNYGSKSRLRRQPGHWHVVRLLQCVAGVEPPQKTSLIWTTTSNFAIGGNGKRSMSPPRRQTGGDPAGRAQEFQESVNFPVAGTYTIAFYDE